jgi:hypothetical protein
MRHLDEVRRLEHELPPRDAHLVMAQPLQPALRDLTPLDLDVLQLVLNQGVVQSALDRSPHTDLETLTSLQTLISKEYLFVRAE